MGNSQKYTTYDWNLGTLKLDKEINGVSYIHIEKLNININLFFKIGTSGDWIIVKETDSIRFKKSDIYFKADIYNLDNDEAIVRIITSEDITLTIDRMSNHNIQTINPKVIKELQIVKDIDIEALHKINRGKWLLNPTHKEIPSKIQNQNFTKKSYSQIRGISHIFSSDDTIIVYPFQKVVIKLLDNYGNYDIDGIILSGNLSITEVRKFTNFSFVNTTSNNLEIKVSFLISNIRTISRNEVEFIEVKFFDDNINKFHLEFSNEPPPPPKFVAF